MISVFISHSHEDAELVRRLITLLRSALNLPSSEIRATSVDGFRLPGGANVDERLRAEVQGAKVLVGVISKASVASAFVTFELGARWGSGRPMVPLLASDADRAALAGPLNGVNALSCRSSAQLHQFVEEMATQLGTSVDRPSTYQKCVDEIVDMGSRPRESNHAPLQSSAAVVTHNSRPAETAPEPIHRAPHLGQSRLSEAERDADRKLRDGAPVTEVVESLERRGISRRVAEEMTRELKQDLDK